MVDQQYLLELENVSNNWILSLKIYLFECYSSFLKVIRNFKMNLLKIKKIFLCMDLNLK